MNVKAGNYLWQYILDSRTFNKYALEFFVTKTPK